MNDDAHDPSLHDPEPREKRLRLEILLQHFFDETLFDEEAREVLELFDRFPSWKVEAQENFETERLFRFERDLQKILPAGFLEKLVASARQAPENAGDRSDHPAENSGFWLIDMDELARLAAESPSLPRPEPQPADEPLRMPLVSVSKTVKPFKPLLPLKFILPLLLLAFGLVVYLEFRTVPEKPEPDDPFGPFPARISELIDATFPEDAAPLKKGRRLEAGPVEIRSGLMEIEYKNGIRVVLEGPARYHVETLMESACDFGKLSADVPPAGRGFTVTTPKMTVRDLGTKFAMNIDGDKTELHVVEGEVEANWLTKDWLPFKAGRGVERREGRDVRNFVADLTLFVFEKRLRDRKAEYVERRRTVWEEQRHRQSNDPALLYDFAPEDVRGLSKTPGSRGHRRAVSFRNKNDRHEIDLRGEYDNLTMIASARLKNPEKHSNTLLMGNAFGTDDGEIHWQINQLGDLQLHVNVGGIARQFDVPGVFRQVDCYTWISTAVVVDAREKTVTHYVDGRPIAVLPWDAPVPLRFSGATIGNERRNVKKPHVRFFNGDVEEFLVFGRPFSPEEISSHYRNNN